MSMNIAILAFVASFTAITGWLIVRAPVDHSADLPETSSSAATSSPTESEIIQESEPASDEVIALSDTERLIRSMFNELVIPVVDLDNATLEETIDFLRLKARKNDPRQQSFSVTIKKPQAIFTDSMSSNDTLSDIQSITIYEENITLTKALNLICLKANYRWEITDHGILLTPLD